MGATGDKFTRSMKVAKMPRLVRDAMTHLLRNDVAAHPV